MSNLVTTSSIVFTVVYILSMKKLLLLAASVVFITSCGGGGGGGGSTPSAPAPQNISVSLTASADSAEVNSSITLTWSSTLATSCSASGSWSGSKSTSGSESITIGVGGSNSFSLSCSATGANSGSASTSVNGLRYFNGKVFDGYIRGAEVFVDTNDNLTLDANEASVSTDNAGGFTKLLFGNGTLVSKGGFDLDTGAELSDLTLVHKLDGYETSKLASPFTTLIAYMSTPTNINAALGIDASINLLTTDPIPNLGEGIYDQMYEKGNQLTVLSYTLQNQAAADSSQLYFQAIADQLEESYAANQTAVDIEDPTFISNVIDKAETASAITLSLDVKANLNSVLSSTIPLLKVYADSSTTASVQRFAFSTLQNDVQDSAIIGSSSSATINQYKNNVFEYVATDQGIDETTINPINNNAPTINSSATFSAAENQTSIGTVTATDADGDSLTYSISGSEITISSSGVLTFATAPDYETKTSYTATVTVSDGTDSVTQAITVTITDVDETVSNEAPTISSSATFSAAENQTAIGTVSASDADGDSLTYSISGSEITISSSGVLTFATAPDYETKTSYTATVTVSDGTDSVTQAITVTITDVDETVSNEAPTLSINSNYSVNEDINGICQGGPAIGDGNCPVFNIVASDPEGEDLFYTISGLDAAAFQVSSAGAVNTTFGPNYEVPIDVNTDGDYQITITVSDGNLSVSEAITITVANVNEAPFISTHCYDSDILAGCDDIYVDENQTSAMQINASDPENQTISYSFYDTSGSDDNSYFNISSSGAVTFKTAPDYETKNSYALYIALTDSDGLSAGSYQYNIRLNNLNDNNPVISSSATFSAAENQTAIGSVSASDADGDSLTYSVSGSEINISSSGVLSFAAAPDYETKNSYTATVTVSDGTNAVTQNITVNVTDVVEAAPNAAPAISSSATFSAAENQTAIGSVTATDADGDSLTYSISGSEITISSSGVLTFASAPDYEFKNTYTATVTVSDGTASTTQDITVNINDSSEVAASINLTVSAIKTFTFSWTDTSDATSYNLLEDPDGSSGYSNVVNDISVGTESYTHIVPLHKRINASYILQSCYNSTCVNSSPVNVSGNLENAIGYFKASNTDDDNDYFGISLSLSNDGSTLAVGALGEESGATGVNGDQSDNSVYGAGAVYVFVRSGSTWSQQAYIKSSSPERREDFGHSVSLSSNGNTLAVGALNETSGATGINGDHTDTSKNGAGAVYVFTRSGTTWSQEAFIKSSTSNTDEYGSSQDNFGAGVDLSNDGNTLLVNAVGEDSSATGINGDETNNSATNSGALYVFTRSGTTWSQEAFIKSSNPEAQDGLISASLSGDGDTIALGARGEDSNATGINGDQTDNSTSSSGAAYVFTRSGTTWSQQAYIKASNAEGGDIFGESIDLSDDGNTMVVGAPGEDSNATGINGDQTDNSAVTSGAAYVFTRSGTTWSQQAYIKANLTGDNLDYFGESVQLSGDGNTLAVGTQQEDSNATGINGDQTNNSKETSGAAYVFTRSGTTWSQQAYIKASNADGADRFGGTYDPGRDSPISMSNNGDILVIGAYQEESNATGVGGDQTNNTGNYSGAVYIY